MIQFPKYDKTISWILKIAVGTLSLITIIVIVILALSLFWDKVDQQMILGILGPAINTIIGAFVGLLGGLTLNGNNSESKESDDVKID